VEAGAEAMFAIGQDETNRVLRVTQDVLRNKMLAAR
jgi:hypothetical protein